MNEPVSVVPAPGPTRRRIGIDREARDRSVNRRAFLEGIEPEAPGFDTPTSIRNSKPCLDAKLPILGIGIIGIEDIARPRTAAPAALDATEKSSVNSRCMISTEASAQKCQDGAAIASGIGSCGRGRSAAYVAAVDSSAKVAVEAIRRNMEKPPNRSRMGDITPFGPNRLSPFSPQAVEILRCAASLTVLKRCAENYARPALAGGAAITARTNRSPPNGGYLA